MTSAFASTSAMTDLAARPYADVLIIGGGINGLATFRDLALQGVEVKRTTVLSVDTATQTGGISNIPFVVQQADTRRMVSTFWIHELCETDDKGKPRFLMQYLQDVALDFLPRTDGTPGLIRWPHISINTLEKVSD